MLDGHPVTAVGVCPAGCLCLLTLLLLQDQSVELVEDPDTGVADNNPAPGKWDEIALWLGVAVGDIELSLVHPLPERRDFALGDLVRHRDVAIGARYTLLAFRGRVEGSTVVVAYLCPCGYRPNTDKLDTEGNLAVPYSEFLKVRKCSFLDLVSDFCFVPAQLWKNCQFEAALWELVLGEVPSNGG